jgi:hypothetical protein
MNRQSSWTLLLLCLFALVRSAGPVNSHSCTPFAAVNSDGDTLIAGDVKAVIFYNNRTSAFRFQDAGSEDRFSGGLADVRQNGREVRADGRNVREDGREVRSIACSNSETFLFYPERTLKYPGGEWRLMDESRADRICAMTIDSNYAVFYKATGELHVNGFYALAIAEKSTKDLVAAGSKFIIMSSSGTAHVVTQQASVWAVTETFEHQHKAGGWTERIRFAANSDILIKSDSEQLHIINLKSTKDKVTKINVSPCDKTETCVPWVSETDGCWSVSGI